MRVCVTGATGFIGRALVPVLRREGHDVTAWVRSEDRARSLLGADVEIVSGSAALTAAVGRADAVVNLAGEAILGKRWTADRRAVLRSSRVGITRQIVEAMQAARQRPRVFVSGSAVGFYGDRGDETLTEDSAPGTGFLADLSQEWEGAAQTAESFGVRVVRVRTGIVLGRDGGALGQMLTPFKLGAGGPMGSGRQYMPWIHLHDYVQMLATAIADDRYTGAINGVTASVTSLDFARALGRALHRPAFLPMPGLALRLIFGDAATVLLGSQRITPRRLADLGFPCAFASLDSALADIVGGASVTIAPAPSLLSSDAEERSQLGGRRPAYMLRTSTVVNAPVDETFAFFSRAENLGALTPASMQFVIEERPVVMGRGATIRYRLRVGPVPIGWKTLIASWDPGHRFVDLQESGPYRTWWHEHAFHPQGSRTLMEDRVLYSPPLGFLGRLAHRYFIAPTLRRIFQYRGDVIRLRFGDRVGPTFRSGARRSS